MPLLALRGDIDQLGMIRLAAVFEAGGGGGKGGGADDTDAAEPASKRGRGFDVTVSGRRLSRVSSLRLLTASVGGGADVGTSTSSGSLAGRAEAGADASLSDITHPQTNGTCPSPVFDHTAGERALLTTPVRATVFQQIQPQASRLRWWAAAVGKKRWVSPRWS